RRQVASALRRHRAFTALVELLERSSAVELTSYSRELPSAFPAVAVSESTWLSYARAFVLWFEYAALVRLEGQMIRALEEDEEASPRTLLSMRPPVRIRGALGQQSPGPVVELLMSVAQAGASGLEQSTSRSDASALRD